MWGGVRARRQREPGPSTVRARALVQKGDGPPRSATRYPLKGPGEPSIREVPGNSLSRKGIRALRLARLRRRTLRVERRTPAPPPRWSATCGSPPRKQGGVGAACPAPPPPVISGGHPPGLASGRSLERRPGLCAALAAIAAGEASSLVGGQVRPAHALGIDAARTIEQARPEGWNLVALALGVDFSTAMTAVFAQLDRAAADRREDPGRRGGEEGPGGALSVGPRARRRRVRPAPRRRRLDRDRRTAEPRPGAHRPRRQSVVPGHRAGRGDLRRSGASQWNSEPASPLIPRGGR